MLAGGSDRLWYTLITHMFLHGSLNHIFYNLFFTSAFAVYYESLVGSQKFLRDWLLSGIGACLFYLAMPSLAPEGLIGASGACSGIFALALLHFRKSSAHEALALCALAILFFSNLLPGIVDCIIPSGIGHMAHVGGMLTGMLIYCIDSKNFKKGSINERKLS
jgi:membrane associated rhomboid family serine protease